MGQTWDRQVRGGTQLCKVGQQWDTGTQRGERVQRKHITCYPLEGRWGLVTTRTEPDSSGTRMGHPWHMDCDQGHARVDCDQGHARVDCDQGHARVESEHNTVESDPTVTLPPPQQIGLFTEEGV